MIIRSLCTSAVSSSALLPPSLRILAVIARSTNPLLQPDRNPLLRYLLDKTLYAQFCAGETEAQVQETISKLKTIGFTGVILAYAKEAPPQGQGDDSSATVAHWEKYTLETIRMADADDFVAVKLTGAGQGARDLLINSQPPDAELGKAIDEICQLAKHRRVRILFDGEQDALQSGINVWTMLYASRYNTVPGRATLYGTYQAYKRSMPDLLVQHLAEARKQGFTLGVKLVRGAYMHSDPRDLIFSTKEETHTCYDESAASLLSREWNDTLRGDGAFPDVSLMLATHNARSVRRAYSIRNAGQAKSQISFAQLQGMADEISCQLVQVNQAAASDKSSMHVWPGAGRPKTALLPVYKYMAWGTTGECIKYLLRRAEENRDAVERTREDRDAMWAELKRRLGNFLGGV